jgi:hypothetical protein
LAGAGALRRPDNKFATASQQKKESSMLPTVIYILDVIRRALEKANRGLSMVADAFEEALHMSHAARKRFPFGE